MNTKIFAVYSEVTTYLMLDLFSSSQLFGPNMGAMINLMKANMIARSFDGTNESDVVTKLTRLLEAVRNDGFVFNSTEYKKIVEEATKDLNNDVYTLEELARVDEKFANSQTYRKFKEMRDRFYEGEDLDEITSDVLSNELNSITELIEKVTGKKITRKGNRSDESEESIDDLPEDII